MNIFTASKRFPICVAKWYVTLHENDLSALEIVQFDDFDEDDESHVLRSRKMGFRKYAARPVTMKPFEGGFNWESQFDMLLCPLFL